MKVALGRLLLAVVGRLPLRAQGFLAHLLAGPAARRLARRRDVVGRNLALAFPELDEERRRRLRRDNARDMLRTLFECGSIWHRPWTWTQRRIVRVTGREPVEAALREGRGVLFLGGHLGNWELAVLYGSLTLPIEFLYKPPKSRRLDALLTAYRSRRGGRMIPTGGPAMRRALRVLRDGGALGMLFDQRPKGGDFVEAPFFGRPTATMTLPHRLAQATGCLVVMGHCVRLPDGRGWKVHIEPVPGAEDPDPVRAATAMNATLEAAIRREPSQYLWHYPRFDDLPARAARERVRPGRDPAA